MKRFQNVAKKIVTVKSFVKKEVTDSDVILLTRKELVQNLMPADGVCRKIFSCDYLYYY